MGKILDLVTNIYNKIKEQRELLETAEEYEAVKINYEISLLEEELANAAKVFDLYFSVEDLNTFAIGVIPEEALDKAHSDLNAKNERSKTSYINHYNGIIRSADLRLKQLETTYKDVSDPNNPKHKDYLDTLSSKAVAQNALDNPQYPQASLLSVIDKQYLEAYLMKIAEESEKSQHKEEIESAIGSFLPVVKSQVGVQYPVKERLKELKKSNDVSEETKDLIEEYEVFINEFTAIDSMESADKQYKFVTEIEHIVERKNKEVFKNAVNENNMQDIAYDTQGSFKTVEDKETQERIFRDDFKFEYSDSTKMAFADLLNAMNDRNMVPEGEVLEEKGTKYYGYTQFARAKEKLIKVIKAEKFNEEEFKEAFENLGNEVKHIRDMEGLIEARIGSSFDALPTNVDNFRNKHIPRAFKQNLTHNSQISSLYITLTFLNSHDITIEEFVEDPTNVIKNAFMQDANNLKAENVLKGKNKGEGIFALSDPTYDKLIDVYGYLRTIEFMNAMETDPELKKKNALVAAGMLEILGKQKGIIEVGKNLFVYSNVSETIQNVLMAEKDDEGRIPYTDCYAKNPGRLGKQVTQEDEYVDKLEDPNTGLMAKDRPTSLDKVADLFLFEEKYYDILTTIKQYDAAKKDPANAGKLQNIGIKELVSAAQELTVKYLLTHDIAEINKNHDNIISRDFQNQMMNFIKDPSLEEVLNGINVENMGNPNLENLVKNKKSLLSNKEKSVTKSIRTSEKEKDAEYIRTIKEINASIDALDKQAERISKQMGKDAKGQTNDEIEEIAMRQRVLMNKIIEAQNARIEALQSEYEKGNLTKYYFEKRVEQLKTGNIKDLEKLPALFEADEPAYKSFSAYKKNVVSKLSLAEREGKTEEDFVNDYRNIIEKAKTDKAVFLADRVLSDHGIKTVKSLNSVNEFTAKDKLIEINVDSYKAEFEEYKEHNSKVVQIEVPEANDQLLVPNAENVEPVEEKHIDKKAEIDELI